MDETQLPDDLAALLGSLGSSRLAGLLARVGASPLALVSRRERENLPAHVLDSLAGARVSAIREAGSIADLGAGGGFPGLVLAIALPATRLTLVESVAKKAAFLESASRDLELENVTVVTSRAEEWAEGIAKQDAVTARALAPLPVLLEYAAPLLRRGGTLVAWKGPGVAGEMPDATAAARTLGMSVPEPVTGLPEIATDGRRLYVSSKVNDTPPGYPRAAGKASKRPLKA